MIYCDLTIDGTTIWTGVPCMNGVHLKSYPYLPFVGDLLFTDLQGANDPTWDGLGSRYILLYFQDAQDNQMVPLQAIPSQQLDVSLGGQNCTLAFYVREAA